MYHPNIHKYKKLAELQDIWQKYMTAACEPIYYIRFLLYTNIYTLYTMYKYKFKYNIVKCKVNVYITHDSKHSSIYFIYIYDNENFNCLKDI